MSNTTDFSYITVAIDLGSSLHRYKVDQSLSVSWCTYEERNINPPPLNPKKRTFLSPLHPFSRSYRIFVMWLAAFVFMYSLIATLCVPFSESYTHYSVCVQMQHIRRSYSLAFIIHPLNDNFDVCQWSKSFFPEIHKVSCMNPNTVHQAVARCSFTLFFFSFKTCVCTFAWNSAEGDSSSKLRLRE